MPRGIVPRDHAPLLFHPGCQPGASDLGSDRRLNGDQRTHIILGLEQAVNDPR